MEEYQTLERIQEEVAKHDVDYFDLIQSPELRDD